MEEPQATFELIFWGSIFNHIGDFNMSVEFKDDDDCSLDYYEVLGVQP